MAVTTHHHHYINGDWVKSTGDGRHDVTDSSTGQVFARVPQGSKDDMLNAVAAAKAAFPSWSAQPLAERKAAIERLLVAWKSKAEACSNVLQKELGSPAAISKLHCGLGDIHLSVCLKAIDEIKFEEPTAMGAMVVKEALGVVGCITPWNMPINQIAAKVAPAMIVGCTVVLKPSEITPLSANLFAEAVHEAGFPEGVFNMVHGDGAVCGEALVEHPDVDMISFTGSTRAGRQITKVAAETLKVVRTELGGKGAALMLDDANLEALIPAFIGQSMFNSGQSCNALSRMLVPEDKYEQAVGIAKKFVETLTPGRPEDPGAKMGPLVSQRQWETVQSYMEKGIEEGARLVCGGPGKPEGLTDGYFVKPTVFADVKNSMTIAQEEIFGPVLCLIPYGTEAEAVAIANDTIFGLNNAVGSANKDRAIAVARQLRSGCVMINGIKAQFDAPFGGIKQSGNAREWGKMGIEEYLMTKHLAGEAGNTKDGDLSVTAFLNEKEMAGLGQPPKSTS